MTTIVMKKIDTKSFVRKGEYSPIYGEDIRAVYKKTGPMKILLGYVQEHRTSVSAHTVDGFTHWTKNVRDAAAWLVSYHNNNKGSVRKETRWTNTAMSAEKALNDWHNQPAA